MANPACKSKINFSHVSFNGYVSAPDPMLCSLSS